MTARGNESASETDFSQPDRASGWRSGNRTISGAVKTAFKHAASAVSRRAGEDGEPEPRRQRGETEKGFGMAATALLRRVTEDATKAFEVARRYLSDTLDWLNLWEANAALDNTDEFDKGFENSDTNFPTLNP